MGMGICRSRWFRIVKEYSWGNGESRARDYANHRGTGGKDEWGYTAPVGSLKPNGYGLL